MSRVPTREFFQSTGVEIQAERPLQLQDIPSDIVFLGLWILLERLLELVRVLLPD